MRGNSRKKKNGKDPREKTWPKGESPTVNRALPPREKKKSGGTAYPPEVTSARRGIEKKKDKIPMKEERPSS